MVEILVHRFSYFQSVELRQFSVFLVCNIAG